MRDYAWRRDRRYVKGMRRIREDRMAHGADHRCECFCADADKGKGRVFSRFADNPTICSGYCCGNQRKVDGPGRQERRAATVKDWT